MRIARRAQEAWFRDHHPEEGLRERKRRLTRQLISDAATTMFATRGFDNVRVSEVADRVGVSEKTIYNYFPNKESMVLDSADEMVDGLARALRERAPGTSITDAVVAALEADMARFDMAPDELVGFVPHFVAMIENTPALHAAWLGLNDRLARVATEELAAQAGVDPRDPEPIAAGRALMGLIDVGMQSRVRHTQDGLRGEDLREAIGDDVTRAARLLETGLWSFNLPASTRARTQAAEAARAAEEARRQVVNALREARMAWEDVRRQGRQVNEEARAAAREAKREAHAAAREAQRRH
jgi:AcrR family transcriptional regulator